jgi:hypothetical protein
MATSVQSPVLVLIAAKRIYPALRERLLAQEWQAIQPDLDAAIAALSDPQRAAEHPAASLAVVRVLARFEASRELLASRLAAQDAVLTLADAGNQASALQHVLAAADLESPPSAAPTERAVFLKPGGIGGAKSIKLRNFHLDFGELLKIGSAALTSLHKLIGDPNPLLIAASVLTIVQSLVASTTKPIGQDDASLFWSFARIAGTRKDKVATEAELRAASDKERRKFGLSPFTPEEFTRSLKNLKSLQSIAPAGKLRWRLIESYHVSS